MSKTIGRFDYRVVKMGKNESMPFNPFVHIVLADWTTTAKDGVPTISAQLMTEQEIDYLIKALKADLDAVGKRAKSALNKACDEARSYRAK